MMRLQGKLSCVQISAGSRNSTCHQNVQTGSEEHSLGTVGSFPGSKMVRV